ncbi:Protein phosphatase 2C 57 [Hibiscus syriacus]|uniref:Protein phosphatase 2C 57 n=1 Tax=Hibiscus syriacus TaxID=106335 RepID=A0A6A2Y232_HIBSY|nr:Protein phosphatase 2C 57 [Hibiscus syriacus]
MALPAPQLQRFLAIQFNFSSNTKTAYRNPLTTSTAIRSRIPCRCSAIAINAPSSLADVSGIRWGPPACRAGARRWRMIWFYDRTALMDSPSLLSLMAMAAYLPSTLQGGVLLNGDLHSIKKALADAFEITDKKLLNWLEKIGDGNDDSGSTATVMLVGNEVIFISHVADTLMQVLSRAGKAQVLTDSHRPYGSNQASLQEIKRIREAGGWISNGRICGDIAVSRAFGDTRFKTKKNEFGSFLALNLKMLKKGVEERRWSEKFISRVVFNDDLVIASPDTFKVAIGSDAEFVLLASDGLWDYINSSDAVAFVRNQLREHGDVQVACDALAQAALDKGSQDNVSIIIADLGHTEWQNLPVEQQNFCLNSDKL